MLTAITRAPGPCLQDCELTYLQRQSIDVEKAIGQHSDYEQCLKDLGVEVVSLRAEQDLPDAVFIEDTSVIVDEICVVARMGAARRRAEISSVIATLSHYRPVKRIKPPATLEGGDVIRIGRMLYVGISTRTSRDGVAQLEKLLRPYDYQVIPVQLKGCLHLTTSCSYIGQGVILANESWVDSSHFKDFELIDVCSLGEPWAANTVLINGVAVVSSSFPKTIELLEARGFKLKVVEISELEKAEAGLSCLSKIFETNKPAPRLRTAPFD